jgi:hypothetical protein
MMPWVWLPDDLDDSQKGLTPANDDWREDAYNVHLTAPRLVLLGAVLFAAMLLIGGGVLILTSLRAPW